ncbi:hypothetical protein ACFQPC_10415 [Herminiimonas glaciei]|uniref:Lipoprotein n=1 Tax=Herminiimonas glaciei TaxID=523788 RepID=A0ABW2IBL2_9BURK
MDKGKPRFIVLAVMLATLTACSALYEGRYDYSDGWRIATVERVVSRDEVQDGLLKDCRPEDATPATGQSFALVTYRIFKGTRKRIVKTPVNQSLESGDSIYINLRSCEMEAVLPRPKKYPGERLPLVCEQADYSSHAIPWRNTLDGNSDDICKNQIFMHATN